MSESTLRRLFDFRARVDEAIEEGLVRHEDVSQVLPRLLAQVVEETGASAAFVRTYAEDMELKTHVVPESAAIPEAALAATGAEERKPYDHTDGTQRTVAQPLDVAGSWFGSAGVIVPAGDDARAKYATEALDVACELFDNYLFALHAARQKHLTMLRLGHALRHRVLSEGLKRAVTILGDAVPVSDMLFVYVAEEQARSTIQVQQFKDKEPCPDAEVAMRTPELQKLAEAYLEGTSTELLDRLGVRGAQEEVLINGITRSVIVGKIVVTSKSGAFNTFDRDLLSGFAGFVRQRIVDFNKEWRTLASSFREDDVARLLRSDDYRTHFLAPREAEVGILYVDIAGFTRLSEQVLKTPANVANLVEHWSKEAVDIVWKHGGVFDKMVGDCVIALFGPPFYEGTPASRLEAAIQAALEIRDMTNRFPEREDFALLREDGLHVSTGVNLAPLFVGMFGPNDNFTGFSSGMNNTARLQGCALKDEVLVMGDAIEALGESSPFTFGDARSMQVKNVAEPLRFRPVTGRK